MKIVWLLLLLAACADEFDDYNQVKGHRVLGIRAEPPDLRPGESATIDALVTAPAATYQWSWCPFNPSGAECPISEAELRALVAAAGSDVEPPPYDLGTAATASFEHSFPPELLANLCAALTQTELPEGVSRPRCDGRFAIDILLTSTDGDHVISAYRELGLIYDAARPPNANPHVTGGRLSVRGAPPFEMMVGAVTDVVRDVEYAVEVDVPETDAELFDDVDDDGQPIVAHERLVITWFYDGGEIDKDRTSYLDGFTDFMTLRSNKWRTPTVEELASDLARLHFVIRDERGGLDWLSADLELQP
jgi:hypothetical protein